MEQKILVAFDDSENAMRAVDFIAKTFTPENEITLFSVLPSTAAICDMNSPSLTPYFLAQQINFCTLEDQKKELIDEALKKAKTCLVNVGFKEDKITAKTVSQKSGVAKDIVDEARAGYDIVVLGRRGLSGIKEFFLGSVSQKVLHALKETSVLLVN